MSQGVGERVACRLGVVFHFMPALWLEDGGIEITEQILIGEAGAERLSDTPVGF